MNFKGPLCTPEASPGPPGGWGFFLLCCDSFWVSWWEGTGSQAGHSCHHLAVRSVLSTLHSVTFFPLFPFPARPEPIQTLKSSATSASLYKQLNYSPIVFFLVISSALLLEEKQKRCAFLSHIFLWENSCTAIRRKGNLLMSLSLPSFLSLGKGEDVLCAPAPAPKDTVLPGKGAPGQAGELWAEQQDLAALADTQEQGFFRVMFPVSSKGADSGWLCGDEQRRAHPSHSQGSPN